VLNDIGPAIEARGLARIKSYVGRTPRPDNWADAAHIQQRLHSAQFTAWTDADWVYHARLTYRDDDGRPVADYDPKLADTFDGVEFDKPVPAMWDEFRALKDTRVLVIRGEHSDLLSPETVREMIAINPAVEAVTVPDEGHAPLLRQGHLLARISAFITAIEDSEPSRPAPRQTPPFDLDNKAG
jgi:pimeloyl-ACP methyl ester carboxylesterase